jgi:MFS family permease
VVKEITGQEVKVNDNLMDSNTLSSYFSKFGKVFVMASVLWFLFDLTGYANGLFGPTLIARSIGIVNPAIFSLVISLGFGFPGKFLGISTIDKIGRKPLQIIGSAGEGLFLLLFAVLLGRATSLGLMALYGMHEFLGSLGPGIISTAGMLGVELAPTRVRSIVQAITVASGRSGAAIASFLFPILFISVSKEIALAFFAILMFVAAMITFMVPETKGKPLEESSREENLTLEK